MTLNHTKDSNHIVVVCASDNNYAMPLAVMGCSILANLDREQKLLLFIIDGGINKYNKQKILTSLASKQCEVKFVTPCSQLIKELEENKCISTDQNFPSHITLAAYYRIILSELLPEETEKVIYLDCDLVVKGNLANLWQQDLGENYLLAAQDTWIPYLSSPNLKLNYEQLGFFANSKYFNSGVLVFNLKKWRSNQMTFKAIEYLKQNQDYIRFPDQDVLNVIVAGQWGELDPRWNMSPSSVYGYSCWEDSPFSEEVYNKLIDEPYIIHFVSAKKPWNSRHTVLKEYFFEYLDMTAWSGWKLTLWRRIKNRLINEFQAVRLSLNI